MNWKFWHWFRPTDDGWRGSFREMCAANTVLVFTDFSVKVIKCRNHGYSSRPKIPMGSSAIQLIRMLLSLKPRDRVRVETVPFEGCITVPLDWRTMGFVWYGTRDLSVPLCTTELQRLFGSVPEALYCKVIGQ